MPLPRPPLLVHALACTAILGAAEPMVPSLHLGMAVAEGDFRSEMGAKHSLDAALSLAVPVTATLSVRPAVGFQTFPTLESRYAYKSSRYSDLGSESARWNAWTFGADCLYRPGGPKGSLYFLAGAYMKVWRLHSFGTYTTSDRLNTTKTYTVDDNSTKNEPAIAMGLGYSFARHFSLETRTVLGSYRRLSYNTLEIALVLSY